MNKINFQNEFENLFNGATLLAASGEFQEALRLYSEAYKINPNSHELLWNVGIINEEFKKYPQAIELYKRVLELNPNAPYLLGCMLLAKMRICDWSNYESYIQGLTLNLIKGEKVSPPFEVTALIDSPELQLTAAKSYNHDKYRGENSRDFTKSINRKVKIGYFSADFHNHPTTYLIANLFEVHDKSKFELFAFSFGPNLKDEGRQRIENSVEHFLDVRDKSDAEIALLSKSLGIDIAVDLKGYTKDMRMGIFSHRAAPIQVNYLGYPGTSGADYFNYIIADKTLIPERNQKYFSEKIVYLPNCYQANDSLAPIKLTSCDNSNQQLPRSPFIFCCFNNNYKITPVIFNSWCKILLSVPNSILWLLEGDSLSTANLKTAALKFGLDHNRIHFVPVRPLKEHLARFSKADLFLDTYPYSAHTTASDSIRSGVPIVTLLGESFASRVAASLLNTVSLPELITTCLAQYEATAIELALDQSKLSTIKEKLLASNLNSPLFNTELFAQNLEKAYEAMIETYSRKLPPSNINL